MSEQVSYRCLDHPNTCNTFEIETDEEPLFCPFCGNQSVVPVGTSKHDWKDESCPHCGSEDVEYREDEGIWMWNATCNSCVNGYAVQKSPSER